MSDELQTTETPVVPTTPEPVVTSPAPTVTETATPVEPSFSFLSAAREAGFPVDRYESDEAAAKAFFNHVRQLEYTRQPQPEPEPPKQEEEPWDRDKYFQKLWDLPEYNPAWEQQLVRDDQGRLVPREDLPWMQAQEVLGKYQTYQDRRTQLLNDFISNPYKATWGMMEEMLKREGYIRQDDLQTTFQSKEVDEYIQGFRSEHEAWLSTTEGRQFLGVVAELEEGGMTDPRQIIAIASRVVPPKQPQPVKTPEQEAETKVQETAKEVEKQAAKEKEASFLEDAAKKAGHRPSGGTATASSEPGRQSPDDIRNMFAKRHSKATAK